jgi:two-component system response regulator HydG
LWCHTKPCTLGPQDLDRPILIAESEAMQGVLKAIEVLAPTPATVLIEGETGVGKELVARAIHATSNRAGHPFIAVNCGAIPEGIVESVLFGHEKGAFTGAIDVHRGYFERADGGTLFLDEIDALTPAVQVRLLRVLQEGELERVGGQRGLSVDVRIVAATNFGLARAVEAGSFRRDLFYRLNVVSLFIPRLSERSADIPHLVKLILKRLALRYRKTIHGVSPSLMNRLIAHDWPGNVRELENTLERAALFAQGPELNDVQFTSITSADSPGAHVGGDHRQMLENTEKNFLKEALRRGRGDVDQLANEMKISRRAVYLKLKKFGLEAKSYRP